MWVALGCGLGPCCVRWPLVTTGKTTVEAMDLLALAENAAGSRAWAGIPCWQSLVRTIAAEGRIYVVAVCQHFARSQFPEEPFLSGFPPEADVLSGGGSLIVAPGGEVLAGPQEGGEAILTAEIDLGRVIAEKHSLDVAGHYARPDIFQLTVNEAPDVPFNRSL